MKRNFERENKFSKLLSKNMVGNEKRFGFYAIVSGESKEQYKDFVVGQAKDRQEAEDNALEFIKLNGIKNASITGIYPYR